jgi:hypothetical protein
MTSLDGDFPCSLPSKLRAAVSRNSGQELPPIALSLSSKSTATIQTILNEVVDVNKSNPIKKLIVVVGDH